MSLEKTIYIGTFIHCESLTELDIVPNGMIGVDEEGKIAFVLRSFKGRTIPDGEGWENAKIVRIQDHGFYFPGFIGSV
jgi:guanine deaminase